MFLFVSLLAAFAVVHVQSSALLEPKIAEFAVKCNDDSIAVWFNKTALDERQDGNNNNRTWQIYFEGQRGVASCTTYHWDANKNDANYISLINPVGSLPSSVQIGAPITSCGINVFADAINIIYNTTVIVMYGENPTAGIGREEYNKYNIMCLRNRTVETDLNNFNVTYIKTGKASKNNTADFEFSLVHNSIAGPSKPVYKLGEYIKFTLTALTSRTEIKGVIQRCWTTTDGSANSYDLINGCQTEPGTSWLTVAHFRSVFKTEAFRYLASDHNKIYVQCIVKVCLTAQTGSGCDLCTVPGARKRRSSDDTTEIEGFEAPTMVVKSPAFYVVKDSTTSDNDAQTSSSNILSGTNGLIVIILLATLVFVIAAAIIKKVFFSSPAAVAFQGHVVSYDNKALA